MIKTFNWLVLGNECGIYLFTKEIKEILQIWHLEIFHIIESFQIEKKRNVTYVKSISFSFQKNTFFSKIKLTTK